jgi:hypothetical protein
MRPGPLALFTFLLLTPSSCAQEAKREPGQAFDHDAAPGDGPQQVPSDFVRFVKEGDGGHLDTAVTTYERDGVEVVFYGAVHIADSGCYAELNDRFTTCDVLLSRASSENANCCRVCVTTV